MKKNFYFQFLLGLILLVPSALLADTLYVDCQLTTDCITYNPATRSCDGGTYKGYKNLQAALNNVQIGDVILGREGRYHPEAPTYRYNIPTAKNGTSWNEGEYFTLKSADGEWMILDGQNNLPSGSVYAVLGRTNPILQYWKFERIEICNGGSADGKEARGFHADGGPFIFRYCYIHDNYSTIVGYIPTGISGHGWDSCLVEYCHFKDNGSLTTMHLNASHICMYSDYNGVNIAKNGFTYLSQGEHTKQNTFRYNLFEGGSTGIFDTKSDQFFTGRNVGVSDYNNTYSDFGDNVHHNIFRKLGWMSIDANQDFGQYHHNIIDSCYNGIMVGYGNSTASQIYKVTIYNNTLLNPVNAGIVFKEYDYIKDETVNVNPMNHGYMYNNIIDGGLVAGNGILEEFSIYKDGFVALHDSVYIDHNYSYRPTVNLKDPTGSQIIYWVGTRYTIDQFESIRPDVKFWMNAYNPGDYLYKGTTGSARFKTRGSHVLNGDTTIANGGIGSAHPYLEGVTIPSYIGATDPNDDSWVNTVLALANLGTQASPSIISSSTCQNLSFESQTDTFETTFSVTPLNEQPLDVVVGLSAGQATSASDMSCIVRFSLQDKIIGRNGGGWSWNPYIDYTANTKYLFRLVVDVAANTYSIYVTPEGGSEVNIGTDYAFRVPASSLCYWSIVDVENRGTVEACDFAIGSNPLNTPSTLNIKQNSNEMRLSSYPNPSSDQVTIKYQLDEPGHVILSLYDMTGKQVSTFESGYKEKGMHETKYDMMSFPNGMYYINLIHDGQSSGSCKLIRQSK